MLFSELYKIMVKEVAFVGFLSGDRPNRPPPRIRSWLKLTWKWLLAQSFQFPHVNKKCLITEKTFELTVIKTCGSDEINCPDNHLHDVIHF